MPSKNQYYLVRDDAYDSRVPLHNEDAFQHGILFQAKYIGSSDVPRPNSRIEIVSAMRRIRYEFKAQATKKKKINLLVSVEGVKIMLRSKHKRNQWWDENRLLLMHHPIYRIFYVSHDSQDLKIFSFIARDGSSNVFKCNVFKSHKKNHAMKIVRTIGQAFEVSHKLTMQHVHQSEQGNHHLGQNNATESTEKLNDVKCDIIASEENNVQVEEIRNNVLELTVHSSTKLDSAYPNSLMERNNLDLAEIFSSPDDNASHNGLKLTAKKTSLDAHCDLQYLQEQLHQQQQETKIALSQVQSLKDNLAIETSHRLKAQLQNQQLLDQNKILLERIKLLRTQINELQNKKRICNGDTKTHDDMNTEMSLLQRGDSGDLELTMPVLLRNNNKEQAHSFEPSCSNLTYSTHSASTAEDLISYSVAKEMKLEGNVADRYNNVDTFASKENQCSSSFSLPKHFNSKTDPEIFYENRKPMQLSNMSKKAEFFDSPVVNKSALDVSNHSQQKSLDCSFSVVSQQMLADAYLDKKNNPASASVSASISSVSDNSLSSNESFSKNLIHSCNGKFPVALSSQWDFKKVNVPKANQDFVYKQLSLKNIDEFHSTK